ncbi:MAG: spherulation-specific family 4 protein [Terriglobales bacterium]
MTSVRRTKLGRCFFVLGTAVVLAVVLTTVMAVGQTRIGVPSYQDPGSTQWAAWAKPGAKAVGIMIVNLNNGDDETYYASVDHAIRDARKQGILVLGYTYTGYGARDPKIVRRKINAVYRNYLVDGIFFDEAPTDCNDANQFFSTQFLYYESLTNYVREQAGARITVLNPGTYSPSDCWMGITNILMNWEDQGLTNYQDYYVDFSWVHKYPPDRFWHIIYGMGADQLQTALDLAKQRNAGWVYLTQETGNPYASPPEFWAAETAAVKHQGVQAPFASAWPDSFDPRGARLLGRTSIRWDGGGAANWQIFLDTDQNAKTGYNGGGIAVGAEYLFETDGSTARLWRYAGTGTDWNWREVAADAAFDIVDTEVQVASFDTTRLGGTQALNFQIRALNAAGQTTYDSYVLPLSLNNTGMVFDITNHRQ